MPPTVVVSLKTSMLLSKESLHSCLHCLCVFYITFLYFDKHHNFVGVHLGSQIMMACKFLFLLLILAAQKSKGSFCCCHSACIWIIGIPTLISRACWPGTRYNRSHYVVSIHNASLAMFRSILPAHRTRPFSIASASASRHPSPTIISKCASSSQSSSNDSWISVWGAFKSLVSALCSGLIISIWLPVRLWISPSEC